MTNKMTIRYLDGEDFILQSKRAVATWYMKFTGRRVLIEQVRLVWYSKTLQDHKAILCVPGEPDNYMFEMTYDGLKAEAYLDAYEKLNNTKLAVSYSESGDIKAFKWTEQAAFGEVAKNKIPELDAFVADDFTVTDCGKGDFLLTYKYKNPMYIEKIADWFNNLKTDGNTLFAYRGVVYMYQGVKVMTNLFDPDGNCSEIRVYAKREKGNAN